MQLDVRVGKVMGISLQLHWSWIPFLGLSAWLLASHYLPEIYPDHYSSWYWLAAITMCVAGFVSILIHEIGHLAVAMRYRIRLMRVVLFPFGGVPQFAAAPAPRHAALFTLSGPLSSGFIALLLAATGQALAEPALLLLALFNTGVALFNLIPGEPLDGAGLLRSQLSPSGRFRLLYIATFWIGQGIGAILIWSGGLTLLLGYYRLDGLLFIVTGYMLLIANDITRVIRHRHEFDPLNNLSVSDLVAYLTSGDETPGRSEQPTDLPPRSSQSDIEMTMSGGSDGAFLAIASPASLTKWTIPVNGQLNAALEKMDRYTLSSLLVVDDHCIIGSCSREDILTYRQRVIDGGKPHAVWPAAERENS
jgi:Zn-dependent protease